MPDWSKNAAATRILIAEDEAIVAEDLALTVQDLGYHVVGTASTGLFAVQLAEESKPDLILMDIKLAGEIDGIEASEQIRARFDIPVIFLTAYGEADVISRAKLTEPYGFLAKPFSYHILKTTIETALYKHAADRRMRESEERYRTLVEQSIDGIALIQGTILRFVNPALVRMFGYQAVEEMQGQNFSNFVAPEYRDLMEKRGFERDAGNSVPESYEFTALRKDGSPFTAEVRVNLTTYQGETARQGIVRDISERKRAEKALRESEALLRRTQQIARVGSWQLELTTNHLAWSDEVYRIFGVEPQEFAATYEGFLERVHPEDRSAVDAAYSRSLKEGRDSYEIEHRIVTKDSGQIRHVHEKCEHFRDSSGQIIRSVGMVQDITEQKKAEEAIRESEEKFRLFMDNSPAIAWMKDDRGRHVYLSNTYEKRFGVRLDDCLGKTDYELWPQEIADSFWKNDQTVLDSGSPLEVIEQTIDGERQTCSWLNFKFPFQDAAGSRYVGGIYSFAFFEGFMVG